MLDHLPAAWSTDAELAHGRIEWRELRVCDFDLDSALFPGARQLMSITRHHMQKKGGDTVKSETRHFITSLTKDEASYAKLVKISRQHWSIENKNHWRKDATHWREDRSPRRNPKGAKNLALLRNALLTLINPSKHSSLNQAFIHHTSHRAEALQLLTKASPNNH